jgi:cytochrome c oxidase subunit 3
MSTVLERPTRPARGNGHVPPPPPRGGDGRGPSPHGGPLFDNAVLATLFLIAGETMLFAGLVFSFWILRLSAPAWPPPSQPRLPVVVTGLNTLVLLSSSWVVVTAGRALRAGDAARFTRRLALAALLGVCFVAVQGYEWVRLVAYGLSAAGGTYGTTFYTLIGTHGVHVVGAVAWLGIVALLAARGRFADGRRGAARACALYWHFVVALWPILYVSVYLL